MLFKCQTILLRSSNSCNQIFFLLHASWNWIFEFSIFFFFMLLLMSNNLHMNYMKSITLTFAKIFLQRNSFKCNLKRLLKFSEKQFSKNIKHKFFFLALKHIVLSLEFNDWSRIDLELESFAFMYVGTLIYPSYFHSWSLSFWFFFLSPLPWDSQQFIMTHRKINQVSQKKWRVWSNLDTSICLE